MPTCPMCNADTDDLEEHKTEIHAAAEAADSSADSSADKPAA